MRAKSEERRQIMDRADVEETQEILSESVRINVPALEFMAKQRIFLILKYVMQPSKWCLLEPMASLLLNGSAWGYGSFSSFV